MTFGRNRFPPVGLMPFSVGTPGVVPEGGGVVVTTEIVVVEVPGVGLPLPQTVVTAATAMTTAPPVRNGFTLDDYSSPSSCRSVMYLTMICGVTCGMSLSGPIFASCTAERNRSVGAIDPRIGVSGRW